MEELPLLVPDMPKTEELIPYLERISQSRHYSNFGPLVKELEKFIAAQFFLEEDNVTTVANATLGLELVLNALDLKPGSFILVPAFTFVATATAIKRMGHVPVFSDVNPDNWLMTPDIAVQEVERSKIDVVLTVASFGFPHEMKQWDDFGRKYNIPVIVDAAAAYGSQNVGEGESILVFSLHTTKSLPAGEGGLVVSRNKNLIDKVRKMSNFGIDSQKIGLSLTGTNAKMSEYHAAVGLVSAANWIETSKNRRFKFKKYKNSLEEAASFLINWQKDGDLNIKAPTSMCVKFPDAEKRMIFESICVREKISTRRWYQPLICAMPEFLEYSKSKSMHNSYELSETLLGLPFFSSISDNEIQRVCNVFAKMN